MSENGHITAASRAVLEYLAARSKQACLARGIAEWIGHPLPRTQAELLALRGRGYVRYFDGHPGTWVITPSGYRQVVIQSPDRYRMALEAIVVVASPYSNAEALKIAKKALEG